MSRWRRCTSCHGLIRGRKGSKNATSIASCLCITVLQRINVIDCSNVKYSERLREISYKHDENRTFCNSIRNQVNCTGLFKCSNDICVEPSLVCDKHDDCGDFSDELHCNFNDCDSDKTDDIDCHCHEGYRPSADDDEECVDIDECSEKRPCSQTCINTPGSYKCSCVC